MNLSPAQLATLKAAVQSEPAVAADLAAGADGAVAEYYNQASTYIVWRTRLSSAEVYDAVVWTELIGRSVGERDTLQILLQTGNVNPSKSNVRSAFVDIFSGAGGATTRSQIAASSKRQATYGEALFAVGVGSDATPGLLQVEGQLTATNISDALAS